ncbi:MAG: arylsulfatase, partial [Chloroflexota bacterium]
MKTNYPAQPNVIVILVDDMGFADLGVMGSEIKTPNLDQMAQNGVLLTQMYNCARCCPTRASLLTGLYPHNAGVGHMGANLGTVAYQGHLREDAVTIAEVLQQNGYRTLMSGKWHVAGEKYIGRPESWPSDQKKSIPNNRGFDRFYGILDGVTHFFSPHYNLMENEASVGVIEDDYYFTDAITDKAIDMIGESVQDELPFFLYLAHTAPHWPMHARPEDIAKYDGVYNQGWDKTRAQRHEEMLSRDILQHRWPISARDQSAPPWQEIEHKDWEAAKMATYAAMVDRVDQSIGRLLDALKAHDQSDNTLIMFLSDNGGCAEFMAEDGWAKYFPDQTHDGRKIVMGNRADVMPGGPLTYQSYDLPWANVSNAPFRLFKHWTHEGGISTPLIAQWPARFKVSGVKHSPCHVVDIMATILDATGASYPAEYDGNAIQPTDGESFLPQLEGKDWDRQRPIFFEHEGNAAVRMGQFKLVRQFDRPWELYDMWADRTELNDLM